MKVLLDDQTVDDAFVQAESTVEDALRHVQSHLCAKDRLVIGLRCDGLEVPAHSMAETLRRKAGSFDRLEVVTATRDVLVIDAMTQASSCLSETEETCSRIVEMLNQGRIAEGAEALAGGLRTWRQIHEAIVQSLETLRLDPERILIHEESLLQLLSRPKEVLLQVRDALVAHDYVLLADLLQYEFTEVTQLWHTAVARLRQDAEELRAKNRPVA